ncbi:NAD(P)/FAD-dependent oxidoreductase [Nocardioides deserti]|uniref:NAD(P)/FAD-dependent oxidoreductase n=1 Tax=Nocardioides deserti TaxID=1588644 RepID=UPI0019BA067E|nr:FAD-dependent oxidoreductase [Nocardioides deserti]GGO75053.1 putative ferredoxin reductase [Nocardioides deserti]
MPTPGHHVVIVGAGLSGLRTAERLRRLGHTGPLTLVGEEAHAAYDRPPLSKALLIQDEEPAAPPALRAAEKYAELDLDLRLGVRAEALVPGERSVVLGDGSRISYDQLVVATGSRARRVPAWEHHPNVHTLRTFEDCLALRADLRAARHLTVVGAGVLGGEVAAGGRALGLEVTLVEAQAAPLERVLGAELGAGVAQLHRDHGVDVRLGVAVERLGGDHRAERVVLGDGTVVETDVVVVAIGSVAETTWLAGSGVRRADGVLCNQYGATAVPGVHVVGDAAVMLHPGATTPLRLEHWTSAGDTAAVVAHNVLAAPEERKPLTEVPYFWSDQYDVKIQGLGLPSPEDRIDVVAGDVAEHSFLAVCSREGRVRAAFAMSMPAPLARCRKAVADGTALADLLAAAPWTPKKKVSA